MPVVIFYKFKRMIIYFVVKVKEKAMASKRFWLGMLVMALAFGMTVVGCDDGSTDDNGGNTGGTFVLTDIPAIYNGKYAYLEAQKTNVYLIGCQSVNFATETITLVQISNGSVSIPMWIVTGAGSISRYSGNDTFTQNDNCGVAIVNTATITGETEPLTVIYFASLAFSNGSATKSVNDGFSPTAGIQAPTGLNSTAHTANSITVAWEAVSGASRYNVYAGTSAGNLTLRGSPTSTSYLIEGLSANTTYYIAVSAENEAAGEGEKSAPITVTTSQGAGPSVPGVPAGVTATALSSSSIQVSWNSVSGASGYNVYAGTASENMTQRGTPTTTSFTITGLTANTAYYIAVSARNASGEGSQSSPITATTNAAINVPSAPTGVTATALSSSSIQVSWTAVSGASSYDVYYEVGSSTTKILAGNVTGTSYTHTGLQPSTTYWYNIKAKNSAGESDYSSYSYVTTSAAVPSAPTGVTATALSSSSISVSWTAVSGAASYDVYYEVGSSLTRILAGNTTSTSYTHTGLQPSTTYYYYIKAKNSAGESGYSTLRSATTSAAAAATKEITQFRFADFSVNATINGPNITVTVPNIVNLTTLVPTIVHNGRSISPASGVAQDFSSPIHYTVTADDNTTQNYTVTVTVTNTTLATAFTWINNYTGSTRDFTIVAQANASIAPVTIDPNYSSANIILSGGTTEKTISLSSNGSLFTISYGTLTLGNNITLQGRSSNNASLINVARSNLVMNAGSKIVNNTAVVNYSTASDNAYGGGVLVDADGTFTMNGGTISGNRVEATSNSSSYSANIRAMGGGVYVYANGTFIMNGGTISGNSAYSAKFYSGGGGVFVDGTFTMINGTISGNTAQSSSVLATSYTYGGGVAAWTSGTFTMQGGTISGNTVSTADGCLGGGVYVRNDLFRKTGGTIYGSNASPTTLQNTAANTNSGHAVYASVGSSSIMRRNTTAGTSVNMDSSRTGSAGGWE